MEDLFFKLQAKTAEGMPELSLVDEDYGQLEALLNGEDTYPVTFPCVLMGNIKMKWKNTTPFVQQGEGTITVRLAFDCYHDTHYGSGTEDKIRERLQAEKKLYKLLQGYRLNKEMGRLKRVDSMQFSLPGGIKVYELIFGFEITDSSASPQ
ncbi:hypothetical protein [uncultured Culturomica sp.]|jgi:hypothetical protein|uniref:hypothetical protein n=1 Tax=uncultured Culturomica sp. TaxID=1926654 RepID=UPI00034093B9|nr:hypothetical protein [uncultured Culturomica sp.]CCZ10505.1 uncharacterized protein BN783_01629 [Odoribacter sp. CAG:788]